MASLNNSDILKAICRYYCVQATKIRKSGQILTTMKNVLLFNSATEILNKAK